MVDVYLNYRDETPLGEDPDRVSMSLNRHHSILWSKHTPRQKVFELKPSRGSQGNLLLQHNSDLGSYVLSSDTIVHPLFYSEREGNKVAYSKWFPYESIKSEIPDVIADFQRSAFGIACHTIFPARQINRQQTINQARGVDRRICDRFDLTLECIRRFYKNVENDNPLFDTLNRYKHFFELFENFNGYVEFFFFEDLIENDGRSVKFWLPFDDFKRSPLPQNSKEYRQYKDGACEFMEKRRKRISESMNR